MEQGFAIDKRMNQLLIAAGLGVAAVGSVIAAPAAVVFGATVAGGSIAGLAITDRLKAGYENIVSRKTAEKLGASATRNSFTLAA